MINLIDLLPNATGSAAIHGCWGEWPAFAADELLHVKPGGTAAEQTLIATIFLITHEHDEFNDCKPSNVVVEFQRVLYWEYGGLAELNGIPKADLLHSPPPGTTAISVDGEFFIICHAVRVLSCKYAPR